MGNLINILLVLPLFLLISSAFGSLQLGCNCILLRDCVGLLRPGQRITSRMAVEIRKRRCGFEGRNLKVCCTETGITKETTTTTTTTTTSTPKPTTAAPTRPAVPPNYHPLSCMLPPHPKPTPPHPTSLPIVCGYPHYYNRIHGGNDSLLGAHPWMVALGYAESSGRGNSVTFDCGGSLITTQHVVTAAHCLHRNSIGPKSLVQLNIGDWNTRTNPDCSVDEADDRYCAPLVTVRRAANVIMHPSYNSNGKYDNDIALIRLDEPVALNSFITPICIPDSYNADNDYQRPFATGWGRSENDRKPHILQEVRLPFVNFSNCNASFRGQLSEHQLCAGGEAGKDSCQGDSGGPLVAFKSRGPPYQLVGLTSFGKDYCGGANNYGVYTVVADFKNWIIDSLKL